VGVDFGAAGLGLVVGAVVAVLLDRLYTGATLTGPLRSPLSRWGLLAPATAAVYGVAAARAVDARHFVLMALFGTIFIALAATDLERHLLPNRVMYPALLLGLALSWLWPGRSPYAGLAGGAVGFLVMLLIFLVLPGFGFGDVKLEGLVGLVVGLPAILSALLIGALLGGVGAAGLLITRRAGMKSAIAYGPYLAGGALIEMLLRR
jgi:leader peptidase (prepilin peptidase)/N-methyltransferase